MSGHLLKSKTILDEYQMHLTTAKQKKKQSAKNKRKWHWKSHRHQQRTDLRLYALRQYGMQATDCVDELNNE